MGIRNILVVTGTRADYGLQKYIMQAIQDDPDLNLEIIATMMHLSTGFGNTYKEIERDGFSITECIETLPSSDSEASAAISISLGVTGFTDAFMRYKPDIILLLGDRVEMLSAAIAATICKLPIGHMHGGERTEGAVDECFRHSITKMSHIHFASTEEYRRRVIQLGEQPRSVFNVGAPGLETVLKTKLLGRDKLERSLDFNLGNLFFLITYHPVTLEKKPKSEAFGALLAALDLYPDIKVIFTYPNSDMHGRIIIDMIQNYASKQPNRIYATKNLGSLLYLSAVNEATCVIGNSSSGLVEVPFLKTPAVNIGRRQLGRIAPESVLHCAEDKYAIKHAIDKAISSDFIKKSQSVDCLHGDGIVSSKVVSILKKIDLNDIIVKSFYDIKH